MALLFHRRVKVLLASTVTQDYLKLTGQVVEITDLRVQFKVSKGLGKEPNTCELTITNLSPSRRGELKKKGAKVVLQAGYDDSFGQLFMGDARTIDHRREGSDWSTVIKCGDGERSYKHARVKESFAGGSKIGAIVEKVAGSMGLGLGNLKTQTGLMKGEYVNGYAAFGPSARELDKVLKAQGYTWSVQDGQLQILRPGEASTEQVPDLTPETGLIGSPEMGSSEKKGGPPVVKARCLLQPLIRPGSRVKIKAASYDGTFKILKVTHTGDTAGGDWYTDMEATPL